MRNLVIVGILSSALTLSSCTSTPEDTAALVKSACDTAKDLSLSLQPLIDGGVVKGKDARNIEAIRISLFGETPPGLCVGAPPGTLAQALVRVTAIIATLAVIKRNAEKD